MNLADALKGKPLTLESDGCETGAELYNALINFAYLHAGKLNMPKGEYGEPIYPEELSMTELLAIVLEYFNSL